MNATVILIEMAVFAAIFTVAVLASLLNAIRVTKDPLIDMKRLAPPRAEEQE